jgi:hypothetical protein
MRKYNLDFILFNIFQRLFEGDIIRIAWKDNIDTDDMKTDNTNTDKTNMDLERLLLI